MHFKSFDFNFKEFKHKISKSNDNKNFENMYMTSFLQALIEKYNNAKAVEIDGNWCEIDFMSDLKINFI
ncbi:hypothetical protein RC12_01415 [Campylobacter jejuni]|nr:hypothetical protein RC12_01415 [Campylobacter jejuni]